MAALTRQPIGKAGTAITFAAAGGSGDTLTNPTGSDVLLVKNDDASPITVTLVVPGTEWNGVAKPDTAVTVAAGAIKGIQLDPRYKDSNGVAAWTYSATTSVTVAVIS